MLLEILGAIAYVLGFLGLVFLVVATIADLLRNP